MHLELTRQKLDLKAKGHPIPTDLDQQEKLAYFRRALLEKAMAYKEVEQKKNDYSIDKELLDYPVMSVKGRTKSALKEIQTADGMLLNVPRNGFQSTYYTNKQGVFLSTFDGRVLLGVSKIWEMKGKKRIFEFTFNELSKAIHGNSEGEEYNILAESLVNIAATSIVLNEFSGPDLNTETMTTHIHNPITSATVSRSQRTAVIEFSQRMHENLLNGKVVNLSMTLFNDLASETSKLLYPTLLNKAIDGEFTIPTPLLFEHLDLQGSTAYKNLTSLKISDGGIRSIRCGRGF